MRRLGIAICLLSLWAAPGWASDENPDPPPPDDVECPEGSTEMDGGSACMIDESEDCPAGFATTEIMGWKICTCESGETNGSGECVTGGDNDDGTDGCPAHYHEENGFCVSNYETGENGCPYGYEPTPGGGWCTLSDECALVTNPECPDILSCPAAWGLVRGTGLCFPLCVVEGGDGDGQCLNDWDWGDPGDFRVVVSATSVSFSDENGDHTYELDNPVGTNCGPWETVVLGACVDTCVAYELPCPTAEDPWLWVGYPRWPTD